MRLSSRIGVACAVLLMVGAVLGWSLYQWLSHSSDGVPGQAADGRQVAQEWAREQIVETVPEFTLTDRDGRERNSDEWSEQIRVINFWATWCAPCREEVPLLIDLQQTYGDEGVTVLGVAMDEPDPVREFADEFGINYPVLVGEQETLRLAERFGSDRLGLPHTIVADRDGRIVGFHLGLMEEADIAPLLDSLIAE